MGARATTCQTRALEVPKHEANRFFCPVADITANRQALSFLLGGVPCRMNVIKQTVTATWRRSTVASQEAPQPKCETAISGWQSIIASWLRPRSGAHFLLVRPSGWRVAPRRVPLGRRSPGLRRHLRDLRAPQHGAPEMVRALMRRTPITCYVDMALHGTSDRYLPMTRYGSPAKLFASVKYRERRGNCEDKQGASCFWRCGLCVGARGRRVRSRPTRATSTAIGGGSRSGGVLGCNLGEDA